MTGVSDYAQIFGSAQAALVCFGIPPTSHPRHRIMWRQLIENWARTLTSALTPTGIVGCVMEITKIHFATSAALAVAQPRL
jgi:hypothetical protein